MSSNRPIGSRQPRPNRSSQASHRSSWSSHRFSTLSANAANRLSWQRIAEEVGGMVPDAAGIANIEAQPVQPNPQRPELAVLCLDAHAAVGVHDGADGTAQSAT
ncbi:hypothetical protein ABVK25_012075 [Lepraria finkii]|uniref:Uncharacterized protein n=1 Tax=Lepraria finkii TaxID=1340010 RepID=A0ABR4ALA0_9LECA